MTRHKRLWMQKAVQKPSALRSTVRRRYGKGGFTKRGTIKSEVLHELSREKGVTGKRARLALTFKRVKR